MMRIHLPQDERAGYRWDLKGPAAHHGLTVNHWAKSSGYYCKNANETRRQIKRQRRLDNPARAEYLESKLISLN